MIALDAKAYQSDETFGYDRWCASQITCGQGTHEAVLLVFKNETEKALWLERLSITLTKEWDVQP